MSFDPTSLDLFIRIASLGAIGKAGREFGLSPTATTQRIQGLEDELGVKLFNRTTRKVALTSDGEVFLNHARKIITAIEDARSDLSTTAKNIKGELRVAAPASFGRRHIAPYVTEFLKEYPDVRVRLDFSDGLVDIVDQGFDLALRIGQLASSTLVARKLAEIPRLLTASPGYLKTAGPIEKPEDLSAHNCIILGNNRNWKLRDPEGIEHEVRVNGNLTTNYSDVVTEVAIAGGGIALRSQWDIHQLVTDGKLVPLLDDHTIVPEWSLWAVRPPGQMVPARVRAFIDFIADKFKELDAYPLSNPHRK
ncbi:LysR family transcriptional regulator [Sneathiella limimaris]|uniref:LysR family transcriptional regulator n=1 Tax=Sneathiella limimaris TaxID=1964213 RepID=UPI00146E0920|nr:LysR family transcriptional regulator [Sneathiella limimaris]